MKNIKSFSGGMPWLVAMGLTGLVAACGGGGGGQDPILGAGDISPVTAPTVTVVSPLPNSTGVPINTKIFTAAFSKPMDATTITQSSFMLACPDGVAVPVETVTYFAATKVATLRVPLADNLPISTACTATVTSAAKDSTGVALARDYRWQFTTSANAALDTDRPTVSPVSPLDNAPNVATNSLVKALFNEAMDPQTVNANTFTLKSASGPVAGTVTLGPLNKNATFKPNANLAPNTLYTATITTGSTDLAANALESDKVWTFTTAAIESQIPGIDLITSAPFGTFGGTAGMTNMGTLTTIKGDIGTTATGTSMVTGFHDTSGDIYTETPSNQGAVNGNIYTCTVSSSGPTSTVVNAPDCAIATQARLDAQTAYQALLAMPVGGASPAPGANLAGATLLPGVYKAPAGSFMIQGGNLTLDAQGDANATWVFQMATTLTVGGPGAAFPQSIILANGAQAKNVFWQVGSTATINAAGGGIMRGTIIAQAGVKISTAGNVNIMTLDGRALSLGASVTMVNTAITVPE